MLEKKSTILIVDDEEEIRKMLNIFLDASDFKVTECDSGKQALRLSASIRPDRYRREGSDQEDSRVVECPDRRPDGASGRR